MLSQFNNLASIVAFCINFTSYYFTVLINSAINVTKS